MTCWEVFASYEGELSNTGMKLANVEMWPHKVNILFLVLQVTQKWPGHQAFSETQVERKWFTNSKMHCTEWGPGTRLQNADKSVSKEPKYRSLDGEATECRLCKHCGCMLNTDYIWLRKSRGSEKDWSACGSETLCVAWFNKLLLLLSTCL